VRVIILMAGGNEAFAEAGHAYPKNLVEIQGLPLVQHVIENLATVLDAAQHAVFLITEDEHRRWHTGDVIRLLAPGAEVLTVPQLASGAACTALHAIAHVERHEPLLVVNGDQLLDLDLAAVVADFAARRLDGGVVTFDGVHPRWSYVRRDESGLVVEAAEKRPISREATAGVYWFARGGDFLDGAMAMIRKNAAVDGRFYICPVYNELILRQMAIGTHHVAREAYTSLSSPIAVKAYEQHRQSAESVAA
jgi:NDP-sugar pyrophosphorylase family protein